MPRPRQRIPRIVHGTPITPVCDLRQLEGHNFCVSFAYPAQIETVLELQDPEGILLLDNGEYTYWRKGHGRIDRAKLFTWVNAFQARCPAAIAVIPDVIEGSEVENWYEAILAVAHYSQFPERLMFCWHMTESLGQLVRAARCFEYVALASCGPYDVQLHREAYLERQRQALYALWWTNLQYGSRPSVHLMRGIAVFPLVCWADSADFASVAINHWRYRDEPNHVKKLALVPEKRVREARRRLMKSGYAGSGSAGEQDDLMQSLDRPFCSAPSELREILLWCYLGHVPWTERLDIVWLDAEYRPVAIGPLGPFETYEVDTSELESDADYNLATYAVLVHFQPEGTLSPTERHRSIIADVQEGLVEVKVTLVDQWIMNATEYYSFVEDEGLPPLREYPDIRALIAEEVADPEVSDPTEVLALT